eukprot:2177914-Rhodomonas_salina.1
MTRRRRGPRGGPCEDGGLLLPLPVLDRRSERLAVTLHARLRVHGPHAGTKLTCPASSAPSGPSRGGL